MLFNSAVFLTVFLPVVLAGFFILAGTGRRYWAGVWLTLASLFFYGWWDARYLPLLFASMVFNYRAGKYLARRPVKALLLGAIAANLLLLGYFKYTDFFAGALAQAIGLDWTMAHIVLPLAISFFTFQQIAYLCDAYDGVAVEHDFGNYCLFITFFPHLIAGPITHHKEMLPQFSDPENFRPRWDFIAIGATLFLIGLFKKVEIADRFSTVAAPGVHGGRGQRSARPDRRMGRCARVHLAALLRFLRVHRHGDRARDDVLHTPAAELQQSVQGAQHHRFLVALAHDADALPDGIHLQPDRRRDDAARVPRKGFRCPGAVTCRSGRG